MTFDSTHTWDCGTPRSTGNAFTWAKPKAAPTKAELRKEELNTYQRKYITAKRAAERVNREASLAAFVPSSVKAPR
jgi:hypothetical protein